MTTLQLAFEFEVKKPEGLDVPFEAERFLAWDGDYAATYLKRKVELKGNIFESEERIYAPGSASFRATIPQRKTPYYHAGTYTYGNEDAGQSFWLAFSYCEQLAIAHSLMKPGNFNLATPNAGRSLFPHWVEFSYDEETGTVKYDLGFAFYNLMHKGKSINLQTGRPPARFWIHTEYPISSDSGAHYLDYNLSWFGYQHDGAFSRPLFGTYRELEDFIGSDGFKSYQGSYAYRHLREQPWLVSTSPIYFMPTLVLRKMTTSGKSDFWNQICEYSINLFATRTKLLFETYPGSSNFLWNRLNSKIYGLDNSSKLIVSKRNEANVVTTTSYIDILGKFLTAKSLRDMIDMFLPYDKPPVASVPFYKHVLGSLIALLSNTEELEGWTDVHWVRAFEAVRDAYVVIGELVMASDVNVLNAVSVDDVMVRTNSRITSDTSRAYRTSSMAQTRAAVRAMLSNEWFAQFDRPKQWRLLTSLVSSEDDQPVRVLNDTWTMLEQIKAKDEEALADIPRRHIKDIGSFHDYVVKTYNAVKYKPVKYDMESLTWLTDFGLDIPETDIQFVIPEDTNVVREWGSKQGHCIGSYADSMAKKTTILLGVWDKKEKGWIGHIQLNPPTPNHSMSLPDLKSDFEQVYATHKWARFISVSQFYGRHNSRVADEYHEVVKRHLSAAVFAWWLKQAEQTKEEAQANGTAAI